MSSFQTLAYGMTAVYVYP